MRRRDLLLRLTSMALLLWILVPTQDWSEKTGEALVFSSGPMLSQVFLWLGWFQRSAERWAKSGALQLVIVAIYVVAVFVVCDAVGSFFLERWW